MGDGDGDPVPGLGAGELLGVVAVGALAGGAELAFDVAELGVDVSPPQLASAITNSAMRKERNRRITAHLLRWANMLEAKEAPLFNSR